MTITELVQVLERLADNHGKHVVTLREVAAMGQASRPAAGMALIRARRGGLVDRVKNLWLNRLSPPAIEEIALAMVIPSYISFESALYHHGILSQSPRGALRLATPRRSQKVTTPLGDIHCVHLKAGLFFGFNRDRMALPEKAWLDMVYIRGMEEGHDTVLTETFYTESLDHKRLKEFGQRYPDWVADLSKKWLSAA